MLAALSAFLLLGTLVLAEEHLLTTVPLLVSLPGLGHQNYLSSWPLPQEPCGRRMLLLSLQETDCEKANMHWALEHPDSFSWIPYVAVASSSSPAKALSISVASACHSTEPLSLKDLTEPDNSMEDVNTLYTSASLTLEDAVAKGYGSTHTLYVTCAHASASNSFLLASQRHQLLLGKRQQAPPTTNGSASVPYSKRPIFQKYVFFNTAVFLGLGSMLLVLLIAYFGLRILAGIQSPSRFESAKGK